MPLDSSHPPAQVDQATVKSFSTATVTTSHGDFTIMEWWFAWNAPEASYVVAQVHTIINPADDVDLEDFTLWVLGPGKDCRVVTRSPVANGPGMDIGGDLSAGVDGVGAGLSAGTTVGVDGTWVESSRVTGNDVKWEIDLDDFSQTASDGAELDFYVQWSCPVCRDLTQLVADGKRGVDFRVEFDTDALTADPNYYWSHSKPGKVHKWEPGKDGATIYGFPPDLVSNPGKLEDKSAKVTHTP